MKLVEIHTKSGLYLGKATQIKLTEDDQIRFDKVLDKYIKGLVFHELKNILPTKYKIKHNKFVTEELIPDIMSRAKKFKWNTDNKDIFMYGFGCVPGTYKSVWITIFYNSILCESLVFTKKDLIKSGINIDELAREISRGDNRS